MKSILFAMTLIFANWANAVTAPSQSWANTDAEAQIERYLSAFDTLLPELEVKADPQGGWAAVEELETVSKYWRGENVDESKELIFVCCGKAACGCFR